MLPSRALNIAAVVNSFAGGSVSEFYELSGEGDPLFPLPAKFAGLTWRPSRELKCSPRPSSARGRVTNRNACWKGWSGDLKRIVALFFIPAVDTLLSLARMKV